MARAIERIEEDITAIKQAIRAIATELHSNYVNYLTILGEALQKQLILAVYHVCTQGYPDKFLKLSLNQRQQLQQGIRKLGQKGAQQLLVYLQGGDTEEAEETEEFEETEETEETEDSKNDPQSKIEKQKYLDPSNPIEVAQWHQDLEEGIQNTLRKVSQDANSLIQKVGILPKKLPEPILAAAAAAVSEASGEVIPGPPNLLNLVIEISSDDESEDSSLTQLITLNLRLGDIEFADNTLLSARKQIRNILLQLNKLGKEYQKKNRELKIAEAEAAWRASWFEG
ncbi:hypothetical protein IQ227_07855 [Anabaena aphanizomenioides LEGE 00250]|uniref:Uncharacterized protein n=1 Tax=Sphaerospermopsis aphanizomenoides LEGE 00250 TaxID=2777972 RepID=A0ABR9VBT0_9CYAN|nr:hypothetical protein [Sphaerospermopsis aphanizomenoides]MBE9235946.1 hypothetical protein [Sphaerospermopsis aphanizomenoides LEGE 00250]